MIVLAPQPDVPPKRLDEEEDFLDELPPMDGGDEDAAGTNDDLGADDIDTGDTESDLDDATLEGDPAAELTVDGLEGGYLDDAQDADQLDVGEGTLDFREGERLLEDGDEPGVGDEAFGLVGERDRVELDQGEEGPDTADEELREDELPRLDADEDGEAEETVVADPWAIPGDEVQHPWDDRAWQRVGAPLRVGPMCAVSCVGGVVLACGRVLATAFASGKCEVLEAKGLDGGLVSAVGAQVGLLAVSTEQGGVFLSRDGGATFEARNAWRDSLAPADARRPASLAATRAADASSGEANCQANGEANGELWVVTRSGRLLAGRDVGAKWDEPMRGLRVVSVVAAASNEIVALGGASPAGVVHVVRGHGANLRAEPLPPLPRGIRMATGLPFAHAGGAGALAFAVEGVGVFRLVGLGGGADATSWERIEGTGDATALTFIDEVGTLVVAIHDANDDRSWLLRVPSKGTPRIVAELGGEQEDPEGTGRVSALGWDPVASVVWVAGTFGLAAFRPS